MLPRGSLEFTANFVAADNFIVLEIRDAGEREKKWGDARFLLRIQILTDENRDRTRAEAGFL